MEGKKRKVQPWWDLAERIGRSIVSQAVDKGLNSLGDISKALKLDDENTAQILIGRVNLRLSDIAKIENDLGITILKTDEADKKIIDNIIYNSDTPLTDEEKRFIDKGTIIFEIFNQANSLIFS